jgi:hypothetical protein
MKMRVKDEKLSWDGERMSFANNDRADELVHSEHRNGWTL